MEEGIESLHEHHEHNVHQEDHESLTDYGILISPKRQMIPKGGNSQEYSVIELSLRETLSTIDQSNGKIYVLPHAHAFIGLCRDKKIMKATPTTISTK